MTVVKIQDHQTINPLHVSTLARAVSSWYVRKDNKFFPTSKLTTKISKEDVERACLIRFGEEYPQIPLSKELVQEVFRRSIELRHTNISETVPVWNGTTLCNAGNSDRYIWTEGAVSINTWTKPAYRNVEPTNPQLGLFGDLLAIMIVRDTEREMLLNWLAYCLQNEHAKPKWAPFLYSKTKGSGKSTVCELIARLFGTQNSVTQNNIDKLVARFNMTVLQSKLVICEELNLRPDSPQGNALKTFLTEETALAERKGQEAETIRQSCCFLFTSNHLPLWMEKDDRRYYMVDVDHDGHASGPNARHFSELVGACKLAYQKPEALAELWTALLERDTPHDFSAETLDIKKHSTPLMKRVHGASQQTVLDQLDESLLDDGKFAVTEKKLAGILRDDLGVNINAVKHMMTELGWAKSKVKWGRKDYARAIWVKEGYTADNGRLYGPDGYEQTLDEQLGAL